MRKKRKAWWIVGGVGIIVLFTVAMLAMNANSADAKLEATLNDVFQRYGFEQTNQDGLVAVPIGGPADLYQSEKLTAAEAEAVLNTIRDACQDCTVIVDGSMNMAYEYVLEMSDSYHSITEISAFRSIGPIPQEPDDGLHVTIWVSRRSTPFWERVKKLWPW